MVAHNIVRRRLRNGRLIFGPFGRPLPPIPVSRDALVRGTYIPGPTTTGVLPGVPRDVITTDTNFATNGQVVENTTFNCYIRITAANVTFRNCYFGGPTTGTTDTTLVSTLNSTVRNVRFIDCTFKHNRDVRSNPFAGWRTTLTRCYMSTGIDTIGVIPDAGADTEFTVQDSWLHGLSYFSGPDSGQSDGYTHCDLIQIHGGNNGNILGCRLDGYLDPTRGHASQPGLISNGVVQYGNPWLPNLQANAAIQVNQNRGAPTGWRIEENYIFGGVSSINMGGISSVNFGTVKRNKFGRDARRGELYSLIAPSSITLDFADNTYADDGAPMTTRRQG